MMQVHYFTLLRLAGYLNGRCAGEQVTACFSQNKNELIVELESVSLRIGCRTPHTYAVPVPEFSRARRNVAGLFPEIQGLRLREVQVLPYERVLMLELESGFDLLLKLHGNRANILLRRDGAVQELFNREMEEDLGYTAVPGFWRPELLPADLAPVEADAAQALRKVSPVLDKVFARRMLQHMQAGETPPDALRRLAEEAQTGPFTLALSQNEIRLYLFPAEPGIQIPGIEDALRIFLRSQYQWESYRRQYREAETALRKPLDKYRGQLASYQTSMAQLEQERSPEELGHLLMANLHRIPPAAHSIEVEDFYNEAAPLRIKLDPQLSPQDNAQRYYGKHKDRRLRLRHLQEQAEALQAQIREAEAEWELFAQAVPPEQLTLGPEGFDPELLRRLRRYKQETEAPARLPFHRFEYEGFEIFAGKHARSNDELTFRFASKADLWLHARDVPGSHVVIRHRAGRSIPPQVLEYAARLAAFFSKRRTDTLVPVQYTPCKYVRKRKGDPPGMVVVERESVLMVPPIRDFGAA
ncbi:MAG: NFACT RNA binding domain-containing protein [Bacteroidia bacterium]|nr:NFACT RNA binding domain-containing protein [Bacteroidia bacterium]